MNLKSFFDQAAVGEKEYIHQYLTEKVTESVSDDGVVLFSGILQEHASQVKNTYLQSAVERLVYILTPFEYSMLYEEVNYAKAHLTRSRLLTAYDDIVSNIKLFEKQENLQNLAIICSITESAIQQLQEKFTLNDIYERHVTTSSLKPLVEDYLEIIDTVR